jgi:hypothetical protein
MSITTILLIFGILALLVWFGNTLSVSAGKKAGKILKAMDTKYEDFVNTFLTTSILSDEDINNQQDELAHQVLKVLKPEVEGLLAHINATELSDVKIQYHSKYFENIARFAESLFYKRHQFKTKPISPEEEQKLMSTLSDAVQADLTQKMLYLKSGRI